jgi:hypothetical protein
MSYEVVALRKSEFEEVRDCASAMEELSHLRQAPCPYLANQGHCGPAVSDRWGGGNPPGGDAVKLTGGLRLALF